MKLSKIRAGHKVTRYHQFNLMVNETVGHHSADLAGILIYMYYPRVPSGRLLSAAILHDVAEGYMGDIPATAKWASQNLTKALEEMETEFWENMGCASPELNLSSDEANELKVADMLSLGFKCLDELEHGNRVVIPMLREAVSFFQRTTYVQALDSQLRPKADNLICTLEEAL